MSALRVAAGTVGVLLISACLTPTQVTFEVRTDIACDDVASVALAVGPAGTVEDKAPVALTRACSADGKLNFVGSYAVIPEGKLVEVGARVTLAVTGVDLETNCNAANAYRGCVVARRVVSFVPHRALVVPIELLLVCKDVACEANSTCNKLGRCVPAKVELEGCEDDVCRKTEGPPGGSSSTPAASATRSSWSAMPDHVVADGLASTTLTLLLRDGLGAPVANSPVSVSVSGSGNSFFSSSAATDGTGRFAVELRSTVAEDKTVVALTPDVRLSTVVGFTLAPVPDGGTCDCTWGTEDEDGGVTRVAQLACETFQCTGLQLSCETGGRAARAQCLVAPSCFCETQAQGYLECGQRTCGGVGAGRSRFKCVDAGFVPMVESECP